MPTRSWNELSPADSDPYAQGAYKIREHKEDTRERAEVDHVWDEDKTYDGEHIKLTLRNQVARPTTDSAKSFIWAEASGGVSQLYTKDGAGVVSQLSLPVGMIVAYLPGYFTAVNNVGYTAVSMTLADCWKVCDGSAPNDVNSPIWNLSTRRVPDLDDSRFLAGDTAGNRGLGHSTGSNTVSPDAHVVTFDSHTHSTPALSHSVTQPSTHAFTNPTIPAHYHALHDAVTSINGAHTHTYNYVSSGVAQVGSGANVVLPGSGATGSGGNHQHVVVGWAGPGAGSNGDAAFSTSGGGVDAHSGAAVATHGASTTGGTTGSCIVTNNHSVEENRPQYLNVTYLIKIK